MNVSNDDERVGLAINDDTETAGTQLIKENDLFIPKEQFLWTFSDSLEENWRAIDDKIISWVQHVHPTKEGKRSLGYLLKGISLVFTYATQIENGPSLAIIFLLLGMDYIAEWLIVVGWVTALVAQIPKRFVFRKRPYMAGRALQLRKDKTSSFPSRSVVCAIVFGYALLYSYNYHTDVVLQRPEDKLSGAAILLITTVFAIFTSMSRIFLGVHYPSDCIIGGILGVALIIISQLVMQVPSIFGCPSCYANKCYPTDASQNMNDNNFEPQNIGLAFLALLLFFTAFLIIVIPPLRFWEKAAPVFGSFVACVLSLIVMTCPKGDSKGLRYVSMAKISGWESFLAIIIGESNLLIAVFATKRFRALQNVSNTKHIVWNILVFLAFTLVYLLVIVQGRLWILFD